MEPASGTQPERTRLGIILIVASSALLSFGDALVKDLSTDISLWQIYVARSLVAVPILIALLLRNGSLSAILPKSLKWVLLRSLLLVLMWIAYYAALPAMSLSVAAVALYTTPLFIALLSAHFIGEAVGLRRWIGVMTGFVGVAVILRPDTDSFSILMLLPIVAAICYALAAIVTRSKCADERPLVLSLGLNLSLFGAGAIAICVLALKDVPASDVSAYPFLLVLWTEMGAGDWGLIAFLAVVMVLVSTGVAKAYQCSPATIIGTFDYSYLVFAVLWSFALFAEQPDRTTLVGMVLIVIAGLLVIGRPKHADSRIAKETI